MSPSDSEIVLEILSSYDDLLAREIAVKIRERGLGDFDRSRVNSALYKLYSLKMVTKKDIAGKPRWSKSGRGDSGSTVRTTLIADQKRPLQHVPVSEAAYFRIAETPIKIIIDSGQSPNDPYLSADWVGTQVVASVNASHRFWGMRITNEAERTLYLMMCAVDAYVQWRIAQMTELPDATETLNLRDSALRFCTLIEAQEFNRE